MTHWMCIKCGYYMQGPQPPARCPGCDQVCAFNDVTCYHPECGSEDNVDPLLVGGTLGALKVSREAEVKSQSMPIPMPMVALTEILDGLTPEQKKKVLGLGTIEVYEQFAVIGREGDEISKLYVVEKGQVGIETELGRGILAPFKVVSEGEACGWSALVPPYRLTATVIALTRVEVRAIEREALLTLEKTDFSLGSTLSQNLAGMIASRLRNLEAAYAGLIRQRR